MALANLINENRTTDELLSMGYDLDDVMIKCKFAGRDCTQMDFEWRFDATFGNCFMFNTGYNWVGDRIPVKRVTDSNKFYGLELTMYVGMANDLRYLTTTRGAAFYVHNHTQFPYIASKGMTLSGGRTISVSMNRQMFYELPDPFSSCSVDENDKLTKSVDDPSIYELVLSTDYSYTRLSCKHMCMQMQLVDVCNCTTPTIDVRVDGYPVCVEESELDCVDDYESGVWSDPTYYHQKCTCPAECFKEIFTNSVTTSLISSSTKKVALVFYLVINNMMKTQNKLLSEKI